MEIPWISVDAIGGFLVWCKNTIAGVFSGAVGTGAPLFVLFGIPMRWLDIVLLLVTVGFVVFYVSLDERISAGEAKRQATLDAKYLKPAPIEIKHSRWEKVTVLIRSGNESDWRLAIIEADTMLDQFLSQLGYPGSSIGEKLKLCTRANFPTLDDAWTAHKVRNQIAHSGSDFHISQRQALHIYYLYERIFREGRFIG
jgi:hypothetical protein